MNVNISIYTNAGSAVLCTSYYFRVQKVSLYVFCIKTVPLTENNTKTSSRIVTGFKPDEVFKDRNGIINLL